MAEPEIKVEVSFTATPSEADVWTDISDYVLDDGFRIERGSQDEMEPLVSSSLDMILDNRGLHFDPDNTSSPFYPNVRPMKHIRVGAVIDDEYRPLFDGYVQSWSTSRVSFTYYQTRVRAVDAFGAALAQAEFPEQLFIVNEAYFRDTDYDALTNVGSFGSDNQTGSTMTTVRFPNEIANMTGGTFKIKVFNQETPDLPYDISIREAIEVLEDGLVEPNSIYVSTLYSSGLDLDNPLFTDTILHFGGSHIYKDISGQVVLTDVEITPTGVNTGLRKYIPDATVVGVLQRIEGRPIQIRVNAPYGIYGTLRIGVSGIIAGSREVRMEWHTFTNTSPRIVLISSNFAQVFRVTLDKTTDTRNYLNSVEVSVLNGELSADYSGLMARRAALWSGWTGGINVEQGISLLASINVVGTSMLDLLGLIARSESGRVYVSRSGELTFKSRAASRGAAKAVLGGDGLPYEAAILSYDERYIRNSVTVQSIDGEPQNTQDSASIERYFIRTYSESGMLISTDVEAMSRARYLLDRYKEPKTRIQSLIIRPDLHPDLWDVLFECDLSDKILLNYEPMPEVVRPMDLVIQGVQITVKRGAWQAVWNCSIAEPDVFILDQSSLDGPDVLLY